MAIDLRRAGLNFFKAQQGIDPRWDFIDHYSGAGVEHVRFAEWGHIMCLCGLITGKSKEALKYIGNIFNIRCMDSMTKEQIGERIAEKMQRGGETSIVGRDVCGITVKFLKALSRLIHLDLSPADKDGMVEQIILHMEDGQHVMTFSIEEHNRVVAAAPFEPHGGSPTAAALEQVQTLLAVPAPSAASASAGYTPFAGVPHRIASSSGTEGGQDSLSETDNASSLLHTLFQIV